MNDFPFEFFLMAAILKVKEVNCFKVKPLFMPFTMQSLYRLYLLKYLFREIFKGEILKSFETRIINTCVVN